MNDEGEGWDLSPDTMKLSFVKFDINKSQDSFYYVTIKKYSSGRTENEARNRAEQIQYNVVYKDSVLDLGSGFAIDKASKFRGQNVEVEIKVPVGKKIIFDQSIDDKLNVVSFKHNRRRWPRNGWNYDFDDTRRWRTGVEFTMGADGILTSNGTTTNKSSRPANGEYRYQDDNIKTPAVTDDIQKQIEEEKLKQKETEERIKNLEKKKKEAQELKTGKAEKMDDEEELSIRTPLSSVFSLVKWI